MSSTSPSPYIHLEVKGTRRYSYAKFSLDMPVILLPKQLLLVADFDQNGPIARFDPFTGNFIDEFINSGKPYAEYHSNRFVPFDMAVGPDEFIYILPLNSNEVWRFHPQTGAYAGTLFSAPYPGIEQRARSAYGMVFGPDGNLYVGSQSPETADLSPDVHRFDGKTGALLGAFVPNRVGGDYGPRSMTFGPDGHFYFCSEDTDSIRRHDGTTGAFIDSFVLPKSGGLSSPERLAFGPAGLYVVSAPPTDEPKGMRFADSDRILLFDGKTGAFVRQFVAPSPQLGFPLAMTEGPDGNLYVASVVSPIRIPGMPEFREGRINVFDGLTGGLIRVLDRFNLAGLKFPRSMTFAPAAVNFNEPILVSRISRWLVALGLGVVVGLLFGTQTRVNRR